MISRENYIRQALDTRAAEAGAAWETQAPAREAEMEAWRADVAARLAPWEGLPEDERGERPALPECPQFPTRPEVEAAAIAADATDYGAEWDAKYKAEFEAANRARGIARAEARQAIQDARQDLDAASNITSLKKALAPILDGLQARLDALEGK